MAVKLFGGAAVLLFNALKHYSWNRAEEKWTETSRWRDISVVNTFSALSRCMSSWTTFHSSKDGGSCGNKTTSSHSLLMQGYFANLVETESIFKDSVFQKGTIRSWMFTNFNIYGDWTYSWPESWWRLGMNSSVGIIKYQKNNLKVMAL
jgi:hypothetical protein